MAVLMWNARCWLQRYLPAEIAALVTAVTCATFADVLTNNDLMTVVVSAYSGTTSYYGVLLVHELIQDRHAYHARGVAYTRHAAWTSVRGLALEFGSAELLDSLLFSPALLYLCIQTTPNLQLAVVLSELVSNTAFYTTVAVVHQLRKRAAQRVGGARSVFHRLPSAR